MKMDDVFFWGWGVDIHPDQNFFMQIFVEINLIVSRVYEDPMFCIYSRQDFVT